MTDRNEVTAAHLNEVFEASCARFGNTLRALDYPNGGRRDGIFHEHNLIIHIAHELMERGFHCYAEAAVGAGGNIDLLAHQKGIAIAIEAKMFGDPRHRVLEVLQDLARLEKFTPVFSTQSDHPSTGYHAKWWDTAHERWGAVAIGYQRAGSGEIADVWTGESDEAARHLIHKGNRDRHREATIKGIADRIIELRKTLRSKRAEFSAWPICPGKHWQGADDAWLLGAIFPLK